MEPAWRIVGRDDERARLRQILDGEAGPPGVLISGEPGVGKTYLATVATGGVHGATWIVGNRSSQDVPLAAFADWIPDRGTKTDPTTLLKETLSAFVASLPRRGAAVTVDDVHLLDSVSALLVQRLVLGRHARVVLTARSTTALPEAIAHLVGNGWIERIQLSALDEKCVATLLQGALGQPLETHSLRRLLAATGGSTQFLRELVESERENGGLRLEKGRWCWRGLTGIPPSVTDLVLARIATVPDDVRDICELLALSEPLGMDELELLTSARAVKCSEESELCVSERHRDTGPVSMRLRHPLYGEVLRDSLSPARAAALGRRLDTVLASRAGATGGDLLLLQRALLCVASGVQADGELLAAGAHVAAAWHDFAVAERLALAAVQSGGGFAARLELAAARHWLGNSVDAATCCKDLLADAVDDVQRILAGSLLAWIEFWGLVDVTAGFERVAELGASSASLGLDAIPQSLEACFAFFAGDTRLARDRSAEVLHRPDLPDTALLWASAASTIVAGLQGRLADARSTAHLGHATLAKVRGDGFMRLSVGYGELFALGLAGELTEARRRAQELEECTQAAAGVEISAAGSFLLGQVAWWEGDLPQACRHLSDALAELTNFSPGVWMDHVLAVLASSLAALGRLDDANAAIAQLDAPTRVHFAGIEPFAALARGWVAIAAGRDERATSQLRIADDLATRLEQPAVALHVAHTATRWDRPVPPARLLDLAARVEGPFAALAVAHAEALAGRNGDGLDAVSAGWAAIGMLGSAADAAAQAAEAHRRRDALPSAHASVEVARGIAARTGARTPALVALSMPSHLTHREAQVAALAARGSSNAEIAAELFVSVRTVEGHLNRIYAKLHITGRRELSGILGQSASAAATFRSASMHPGRS